MKPRVVLVDDHALFRAGVRGELGAKVEIVGEAESVAEAVPLIKETDPDVVLLDVHLPDGGGEAVIAGVAPERPGVKFLALSVSDAAEDVIGVIRAGARGYVTKTISGDELADAVRRVADGDAVFSPRLAGFVLDAFRAGERVHSDAELDELTAARARGAAADRARLPLQGDRGAAAPVGQDGREPRLERAAQAPALVAARAHALGGRAAADLSDLGSSARSPPRGQHPAVAPATAPASAKRELDLALAARDRLDAHLDRVAEPVARARAAAGERGAGRVQLEELARQPPRRQEALEDLAEADEEPGADQARDLALPRLLPPALEQPVLEQPGEADLVGEVLDLRRLALARRGVLGELRRGRPARGSSPRPSSRSSARWTTRSG